MSDGDNENAIMTVIKWRGENNKACVLISLQITRKKQQREEQQGKHLRTNIVDNKGKC